MFTGGQSLYEAKKRPPPAASTPSPAAWTRPHFARARQPLPDPADQAEIPHPRLGFFGVIDERLDLDLLAGVADARPDWQLVMIGPVVKIDPAVLPQRPNIHYLGGKAYADLPAYLAGWDVALLPFARNEATRFISPTKTPGVPGRRQAGRLHVHPGRRAPLRRPGPGADRRHPRRIRRGRARPPCARIAARSRRRRTPSWRDMSWDKTWERMARLIDEAIETRTAAAR